MNPTDAFSLVIIGFSLIEILMIGRKTKYHWNNAGHRIQRWFWLYILGTALMTLTVYNLGLLGILYGTTFVLLARTVLLLSQTVIISVVLAE
jgi:hypothetical protein